ncbi:hypothetical protein [Haliea atlantica]
MSQQLKVGIVEQMRDFITGAGREIVQKNDIMTFIQKPFSQMRSEKASAVSDKDSGAKL